MKLQNLTVIFVIITIPIILLISLYITTGIKTIKYQSLYDTGLLTATADAIYSFELNTAKNEYSDTPETKRDILKASIKMFEKSLCNSCNISSYNTYEIEQYIPALVFGMYDGFYMYAPSENSEGKYEHSLKNYVYYSETLSDGTIIKYSLDNYVMVSGKFNGRDYEVKEGYLAHNIVLTKEGEEVTSIKYQDINIDMSDLDAVDYYKQAYEFTKWFNDNIGNKFDYLKIKENNDPEYEGSTFTQHKRKIIKEKLEGVLNSTITSYSEKAMGINYKMPKLSEEDWQKIYTNISMISFFQGKNIGLTNYNGYCVLNSTNSKEYVNPELMYFIKDGEYHDIRCERLVELTDYIPGYKIGEFEKQLDENGEYKYIYEQLSCYQCINGVIDNSKTVYDYVRDNNTKDNIKISYFTSLARERLNSIKLFKSLEIEEYAVIYKDDESTSKQEFMQKRGSYHIVDNYLSLSKYDKKLVGWKDQDGNQYNLGDQFQVYKDIVFTPVWEKYPKVTYYDNNGLGIAEIIITDGVHYIVEIPGYDKEGKTLRWKVRGKNEYYYPGEQIINITKDIILDIDWIENSIITYAFNHEILNKSKTEIDETQPIGNVKIKSDGSINVNYAYDTKTISIPVKHWVDESGLIYFPGDTYSINGYKKLSAIFYPVVIYKVDDDIQEIKVLDDENPGVEINYIGLRTIDGYGPVEVNCWIDKNKKEYSSKDYYAYEKDLVLTPHPMIIYKVDGKIRNVATKTFGKNFIIDYDPGNIDDGTGRRLFGWKDTQTGYIYSTSGDFFTGTGDLTLEAYFGVKITYRYNGIEEYVYVEKGSRHTIGINNNGDRIGGDYYVMKWGPYDTGIVIYPYEDMELGARE